MRLILAADAGGTSTRAAVFDPSGHCLGFARAGSGNPTAVGIDGAVGAIGDAAEAALRSIPAPAPAGTSTAAPVPVDAGSSAAIALAGEETAAFHHSVSRRLGRLGFESVTVGPDLLGMFHSGTPALDGYVLIAGTGAVAARVRDGRLERVAGGAGWLLGDAGSGFWIGHRVARAVVAHLDGRGQPTALTDLLLDELAIERDGELDHGSPRALRRLVSALYAMRPVELARFAPLAFAASPFAGDGATADDAVARRILTEAAAALAALLGAVRDDDAPLSVDSSPVVVGGSVLIEGMRVGRGPATLADSGSLLNAVPTVPVSDGLLGASVLAFRASGVTVDPPLFDRLRTSLLAVRRQR